MGANTLPGDLPGLIRRGSPVIWDNERVVSFEYDDGWVTVSSDDDATDVERAAVALDLTDPTGRVHAAWWASSTFDTLLPDTHTLDRRAKALLAGARAGSPMDPETIAQFRALCLRMAGRSE